MFRKKVVMMRPDTPRNQPPIVAYSDEETRTYPEINPAGYGKRFVPVNGDNFPTRLSGEMSCAIRRQRGTSGVDYWKQAPATLSSPRHVKRASFQNLFFPALDMSGLRSGSGAQITSGRSNGTVSKAGVPPLTRSYTGLDLKDCTYEGQLEQQPSDTQKFVVTDLTSLALEDVESGKSPQLAYFYQLYRSKFRYMDYLEQSGTLKIRESAMPLKPLVMNASDEGKPRLMNRKPVKLIHAMRTMSLPNMLPRKWGSDQIGVVDHPTVRISRRQEPGGLHGDPRKLPQRQTVNGKVLYDKRNQSGELAVKGRVFTINNTNSRKQRPAPLVHVTEPQSRTIHSAKIPRARLTKEPSSESDRKRSVHFSVSDEVYEYAPSDPVKT